MDDVMKQISRQYDEEIDTRMTDLVAKLDLHWWRSFL